MAFFISIQFFTFLLDTLYRSNSEGPDHNIINHAATSLGLHCLHMSQNLAKSQIVNQIV